VKALVRFPDVIKKLSADLNWTTSLGDAIVSQPQDVASAIQTLRAKAMNAGSLKTTPQQKVTRKTQNGREVVTIQSADPMSSMCLAMILPSFTASQPMAPWPRAS
jgi:Protein of unknown function (DUF3300)